MSHSRLFALGLSVLSLSLHGCGGGDNSGSDGGASDAGLPDGPDAGQLPKGWTHPANTADGIDLPGFEFYRFGVALANNGDAVIAYYSLDWDSEADYQGVFKSERRDGTWSHATSFGDENMSPSISSEFRLDFSRARAQVAMSDTGETVITWVEYADVYDYDGPGGSDPYTVGDSFYVAEYRDSGDGAMEWSYPQDIGDHLNWGYGGTHEMAHLSMNGSGETVIAWAQNNLGGQAGVYLSEYRNGSWEHPTEAGDNISPAPLHAIAMPYVAMNDEGHALVAWQQRFSDPQNDYRILKSEYAGSWDHPSALSENINPIGNAREPRGAISDNGDALIVWRQVQGSPTGPFQLYMAEKRNGAWSSPAEGAYLSEAGADHQVAMDASGNAAIVWSESDGTDSRIYLYEYRDGSWAGPTPMSPAGSNATRPQVAMAANGDTVLIWRQREGTDSYEQLFMRDYRAGSWSPEPTLDEYISLDGTIASEVDFSRDSAPRLAISDDGDTLIVWRQVDVDDSENMLLFMSEYRH